ncbi:MAG: hypothetical protein IPM54_42005 [Polyangiaceae bacterium]|nr:hypothetical protein [Polyangiaceae bacterium]
MPELPDELEPAFVMAVGMLESGTSMGRDAGVGFWLHGDRVGGSFFLFTDPTLAWGAKRLAAWGKLRGDRLPVWWNQDYAEVSELDRTVAAPIHAIIDAVVARRLSGPTELTPDELATLSPRLPTPEQLVAVNGVFKRSASPGPVRRRSLISHRRQVWRCRIGVDER